MNEFFSQIAIGIIVAIILGWLGFGGSKKVIVNNSKSHKLGKWIMIISVIIMIIGLNWAGKQSPTINTIAPGYSVAILGGFFFLIGKVIAWFQRN